MKTEVKIILLILGIFVLAFILSIFSPNLSKDYSYSECNQSKSYPFVNYVEEAKWDNNDLIVKTVTTHNCCPYRLSGNYLVNGDNLILNVEEKSLGLFMCMCVCNFESTFKIPNLKKKDYNIILYKDNLTIKIDGSISDYCDSNRTFDCYKKNRTLSEQWGFSYSEISAVPNYEIYPREIRFEKPEYKAISDKYPEFLYYFNKSETLYFDKEGRNNLIVIGFKEGSITVGAHHGNSTQYGTFSGLHQGNGMDFEAAVKSYINEKNFKYEENQLIKQFANVYGVNVTMVYSNEYGFQFNYNNETVDYSFMNPDPNTLRFTDRTRHIIFEFNQSLLGNKNLNLGLIKLVNFSDMIYKLVVNYNLGDELLYVEINDNWTASFDALSTQNKDNVTFVIHNREITVSYPTYQRFTIDLTGKFN